MRFGPFADKIRGFTPTSFREGQMQLLAPDFLPLCAHELRVLLATPNRSGLQQVVTGPASPAVSPLSGECPNRVDRLPLPTLPSADFCAAVSCLTASSVPIWNTAQISRGKPDSFHRTPAGSTSLALNGYGLRD